VDTPNWGITAERDKEFLQGKGWMPKAAAHNNATPEGTGGEA